MSRVGEKIKQLRNEAGLSAKQLGKKLGVAENFINEVESGRKVINQNLIDRIGKVLGKDLNDITMSFEEEVFQKEEPKFSYEPKKEKVNEIWNEAFGSVLKNIPIYDYTLNKALGSKQLPIIGNKIEGYSQDKVFYLKVEDNEMVGFRIAKDDLALAVSTQEIINNSICLVEAEGERKIKQIKKLDNSKVLLIGNPNSVRADTVDAKNLKVIARLIRLEISL
ncbi:XRE family transcriptional regulator [Clostridium malenominatum]|uniref:XRE family transcriptional regulator n=1 Tax=Clostridium malenominatum TaxID=1539 RepID=A0ABP3U7G1_9CLOT